MRLSTSVVLLAGLFWWAGISASAADGCGSIGFVTAGNFPAGNQPLAVAARDFDGDGRVDLAAANYESNDVSILLSYGAEGFAPAANYAVGVHPVAIAAGDFDGDGRADLATLNAGPGNVTVLLGTGSGAFGPAKVVAAVSEPRAVVVGDFNGDGKEDLAVASTSSGSIAILLGDGAGGFASAGSTPAYSGTLYNLVVGRFNADAALDLAAGTLNGTTIFLGNGAGAFTAGGGLPQDYFLAMAAGDFNGDGKTDLAGSGGFKGNTVLLGDGAGGFAPPANYSGVATYGVDMIVGDYNGDGKADAATVVGGAAVSLMPGDGTGRLGPATSYGFAGSSSAGLAQGDFDADGKIDLAAAGRLTGVVSVLYNRGGGSFAGPLSHVTGTGPDFVVAADFNNDGHTDLAVANTSTQSAGAGAAGLTVLLGDGTGRMTAAPPVPLNQGGSRKREFVAADFNRDGKLDIVGTYTTDSLGGIYTLLGNGDGTFAAPVAMSLGVGPYRLAAADFNRDGNPDVVVGNEGGSFTLLLGTGTGSFNSWTSGTGSAFSDFTVADLNHDSNPDLVFARYWEQKLYVYLGNGAGGFGGRIDVPLARPAHAVVARDFNGDGNEDVAVAVGVSPPDYYVSVLMGNGSGGFGAATEYRVGSYPQSVTSADLNGDGKADLVTTDSQSDTVSVLTGDGAGGFGPAVPFAVPSYPTSVVAADLDGDSRPDLAVTQLHAAAVTVLSNAGGAALPCLSIADVPSAAEGNSGSTDAVFNVSLSRAAAGRVRVNFRVDPVQMAAGPGPPFTPYAPTPGADYQAVSGTLVFEPGETSREIRVPILGDALDEFDEVIAVTLSNARGAALQDARALGTITDDDAEPSLVITGGEAAEGNSVFSPNPIPFTITLSAPSGKTVGAQYQSRNGSAVANDYQGAVGSLTLLPGETTKTINAASNGDPVYEPDEDFFIDLSAPVNATIAVATGRGVIRNDDPLPTINVFNASATEGNSGPRNITFNVNLTNASYQTVTVSYATADGTATAGADYTATSGTVTFNPGETSKTFVVEALGDTTDEVDETFTVSFSNASNAALAMAQVTGTIFDDDGPAISLDDVAVKEGDTGRVNATFTITLSAVSPQPVSVRYSTAGGTATPGVDYTSATNRTVQVPAGQLTATFSVVILSDVVLEPDETFNVNLSIPAGGSIGDGQGACTILNDDPPVAVEFAAATFSAAEGAGSAELIVRRVGDLSGASTVTLATVDFRDPVPCDPTVINPSTGQPFPKGQAYARCDYATTLDSVTFAPGETSKRVLIPVINDAHVEGPENFFVVLYGPAAGTSLGERNAATVTIQDDDTAGQPNPIKQGDAASTAFFVRMHYLDFLSREPEQGEPWTPTLLGCSDQFNLSKTRPAAQCDRISVSSAFFGSQEFKLKGFFVFNFYKVAFDRLPTYDEIILDMRSVTGTTPEEVYQKKAAYASAFTQRAEFASAYPSSQTSQQYVDALMNRYSLQQITTVDPNSPDTGVKVTLTRAALTNGLNNATLTRAQVLRALVQSDEVSAAESNKAFVAMQYYGYLRRAPEPGGYQAWLDTINADPNNVRDMVNGFLNSVEYRSRFGQP